MGRTTAAVKNSVQGLIASYKQERELFGTFGLQHSGWLDTIWGPAQVSHVFGLLAIVDMNGNVHHQVIVNSTGGPDGQHAEFRVSDTLAQLYPNGAPFDMKIILYLKQSPCTQCTEGLLDEYNRIYDAWANGRLVFFSITFHRYFLNGNNSWDDQDTAEDEYDQINLSSPVVSDFNTRVKRLLTIRHYSATKRYDAQGQVRPGHVSTDW